MPNWPNVITHAVKPFEWEFLNKVHIQKIWQTSIIDILTTKLFSKVIWPVVYYFPGASTITEHWLILIMGLIVMFRNLNMTTFSVHKDFFSSLEIPFHWWLSSQCWGFLAWFRCHCLSGAARRSFLMKKHPRSGWHLELQLINFELELKFPAKNILSSN